MTWENHTNTCKFRCGNQFLISGFEETSGKPLQTLRGHQNMACWKTTPAFLGAHRRWATQDASEKAFFSGFELGENLGLLIYLTFFCGVEWVYHAMRYRPKNMITYMYTINIYLPIILVWRPQYECLSGNGEWFHEASRSLQAKLAGSEGWGWVETTGLAMAVHPQESFLWVMTSLMIGLILLIDAYCTYD